jgi:hypothetical protein
VHIPGIEKKMPDNASSSKRRKNQVRGTENNVAQRNVVSFRPSASIWVVSALLMLTKRRRLFVAFITSWLLLKASHAVFASNAFQTKVLLLQFTRTWPPCDLEKPNKAQKLPLLLRWIDWLPSRLRLLDDLKSFQGVPNARNVEGLKKRRIGAWLIEPINDQRKKLKKGIVLYFKGRVGHRGSRSRTRFYDRVTKDPLGLYCVTFDGPTDEEEATSERGLLVSAHAVWSVITKPPYEFNPNSVVIWGSSLGCCSAANLCLYLMRRGTPPAALILENPVTSFPKLLASRFVFLGEQVQAQIESFAKANLYHRFDLEKRIRSICSFGINVPVLLVSAEADWNIPTSHAQRLADIASALVASKRVALLSFPVTRAELLTHSEFVSSTSAFVNQALDEARDGSIQNHLRKVSVDYGGSPATWSSDQTAEDRLFEQEDHFGL